MSASLTFAQFTGNCRGVGSLDQCSLRHNAYHTGTLQHDEEITHSDCRWCIDLWS